MKNEELLITLTQWSLQLPDGSWLSLYTPENTKPLVVRAIFAATHGRAIANGPLTDDGNFRESIRH